MLSNFVVKQGDGTLVRIPVMYGDMDRQVASIINQTSENAVIGAPKIAVYINELSLDRDRLADATFVGKLHIREREIINGEYTPNQGQQYTVERLMPTPYKLGLKVDIWSTSTEQKLQILEQILVMFNPSLEIQTSDNYADWSSLTVVDLEDVAFSSRSVPVGTTESIDIASLTLKTPIFINPPSKVKKLGIITDIITSIYDNKSSEDYGYIDGLGVDRNGYSIPSGNVISLNKTTIGNFDIIVEGKNIRAYSNSGSSQWVNWNMIVGKHPGIYRAGLTKICLLQADGSEVVGYLAINPLDDTVITVSEWDQDTYPTNNSIPGPSRPQAAWGSFDAVIDPTKTRPSSSDPGTRYLIIEGIGGGVRDTFTTESSIQFIDTGVEYKKVDNYKFYVNGYEAASTGIDREGRFFIFSDSLIPVNSTVTYEVNVNADGPDAWKNTDGSDFIAEANDIIEWDGTKWHVVFSAQESQDQLIYQTNMYTLVQYKWNGVAWVKSFEGEYRKGKWRLVL